MCSLSPPLTPPSLHWQTPTVCCCSCLHVAHTETSDHCLSVWSPLVSERLSLISIFSRATAQLTKSPIQHCKKTDDSYIYIYIYTQTEDNNHKIFLYVLFSPFGNPRVNIFINHITGHDAPKFTLSVYRNTLNRTQGFTMDTQLTFCPLHLQQWMTVSRFFVLFFSPLPHCFLSSPCGSHPSACKPLDSLTTTLFLIAVEVLLIYFFNFVLQARYV